MLHIETESATSRWRKSFSLLMHEVSCMRIKNKNKNKKLWGPKTTGKNF
jgi:hypothetical protein